MRTELSPLSPDPRREVGGLTADVIEKASDNVFLAAGTPAKDPGMPGFMWFKAL